MIVLDTHALLWWVKGSGLSSRAKATIDQKQRDGGEIIISAMTAWEVMLLVKKKRVALATDVSGWFNTIARLKGVRFVPMDRRIAMASADLPGDFHRDPADRIIVATARAMSAPLVTKDRAIQRYEHVHTIW
jgi:PIN domain nuclease of toxin-antitoxin system